ncbi:MAG: ATP-binding cassette domain-containing protein, partial [Mesorhizobium sp.]
MTTLLSIRDLSVRYRSDGVQVAALKGISLDIEAGERLAIIGESGSGKSTLALAIAGLLPVTARIDGEIEWQTPEFGPSHSFAPPSVLPDISPTRGEI